MEGFATTLAGVLGITAGGTLVHDAISPESATPPTKESVTNKALRGALETIAGALLSPNASLALLFPSPISTFTAPLFAFVSGAGLCAGLFDLVEAYRENKMVNANKSQKALSKVV